MFSKKRQVGLQQLGDRLARNESQYNVLVGTNGVRQADRRPYLRCGKVIERKRNE
jgi:hypothetical protein